MSSLLETMDAWLLNFMEELHTCMPGRIESYDAKERRARVLPLVRPWLQNGALASIKPIDDVPVVFPSSSAGGLTFPLTAGDGVLLVFSEVGIGNFVHGDAGEVHDADDPSRFSLSDCIAIPGLFPFAGVPKVKAKTTEVGVESAKGAHVLLEDKVALGNDISTLRAELEAQWDAILDLYTKLQTLAPLTTGPGSPTTPNPGQVAQLVAAKAQATTRKSQVQRLLK